MNVIEQLKDNHDPHEKQRPLRSIIHLTLRSSDHIEVFIMLELQKSMSDARKPGDGRIRLLTVNLEASQNQLVLTRVVGEQALRLKRGVGSQLPFYFKLST
jgi:hypothetical protein